MVAVRFDGLEGSCAFEDCYVSVRVGTVQKLSRMSAARRVYEFPQPQDGQKYGKVEIFRRIGSCSIDLDPQAGSRAVQLSCQEPGVSEVSMQVTVEEDPPKQSNKEQQGRRPSGAAEQPSKRAARRQAATEYLGKHSIESQLSTVMRAVLQEMPENPAEFLAARLRGEPSVDGRLRLVPVSARLDSAASAQDRTLPRSPAEPSVQRGKKPYSGVRKLAPLGAPKGGSNDSNRSPSAPSNAPSNVPDQAAEATLEMQREPDLDYHDGFVLDNNVDNNEQEVDGPAANGAKLLLDQAMVAATPPGGDIARWPHTSESSFNAYYRANIVGSNVAEGIARSFFPPKQDTNGDVSVKESQGGAAGCARLGAEPHHLVPMSALYGPGFPGLGVSYGFTAI